MISVISISVESLGLGALTDVGYQSSSCQSHVNVCTQHNYCSSGLLPSYKCIYIDSILPSGIYYYRPPDPLLLCKNPPAYAPPKEAKGVCSCVRWSATGSPLWPPITEKGLALNPKP